jgi:hypothetical protein
MHDDSDDDDSPIKSANSFSSLTSPTLKLEQDAESNEFVNVVAPEEEEVGVKGNESEAKTLSVEGVSKPVKNLPDPIPHDAERAPLKLDADTKSPILRNEMPLQLAPESMSDTEQTEPEGVRDDDDDEGPRMPGSFDMTTAPSQKQTTWMGMLKSLGL